MHESPSKKQFHLKTQTKLMSEAFDYKIHDYQTGQFLMESHKEPNEKMQRGKRLGRNRGRNRGRLRMA